MIGTGTKSQVRDRQYRYQGIDRGASVEANRFVSGEFGSGRDRGEDEIRRNYRWLGG
jgi:hypothetical protein